MSTGIEAAGQPPGSADYPMPEEAFDEAFAAPGEPRPHYAQVMAALAGHDLDGLRAETEAGLERIGAGFGDATAFRADPVPRLFTAAEWERIERGLVQRARGINAFLIDAYGDQRGFEEGPFPRRLLETSPGFEPATRGLLSEEAPPAAVCGMDLIRAPDGEPLVLEDNLRTPSGLAYAAAVREVVTGLCEWPVAPRPLDGFWGLLGDALRAAAPDGRDEPSLALLSDGEGSDAWYEQRWLAGEIGAVIATLSDLRSSAAGLFARVDGKERPVDVVYRRIDDRLTGADGALTELGETLVPPLRAGKVRCLNAFGTGLADDKLAHAHTEGMIRFYLGEEPLLRSVPALDPASGRGRQALEERPDDLVVKPRGGFGGDGVVLLGPAGGEERADAVRRIRQDPDSLMVQPLVHFSTHPTVAGGRLRPRHVDLRPFVVCGPEGAHVFPGGLTRFAPEEGEMVVNSSRGGGGKDTWVIDA
jgi:uncharacterized circularly permuted ATP-grasp superfamily protein